MPARWFSEELVIMGNKYYPFIDLADLLRCLYPHLADGEGFTAKEFAVNLTRDPAGHVLSVEVGSKRRIYSFVGASLIPTEPPAGFPTDTALLESLFDHLRSESRWQLIKGEHGFPRWLGGDLCPADSFLTELAFLPPDKTLNDYQARAIEHIRFCGRCNSIYQGAIWKRNNPISTSGAKLSWWDKLFRRIFSRGNLI